jgi:hypothetical protein
MAPLTERQKTAQAIAAELHRLGAAVICLLPLPPDQQMRFQVLDTDRDAVLEKVSMGVVADLAQCWSEVHVSRGTAGECL